ncbi:MULTISPECIES: ABC transporter ATP-binding protein [unclassified Rhizobium]|uniref:ABC transporter ATP-binding protein n=1 Tax=unclassified Rhizobium TaxID=2613769 RepID=UPI0007155BE2|nr:MULTISPECIES: ABC transporter ATP-binding protein [unclassified Rhizobium]KQS98102.1 sugar ABC transporter [Rhizobium sp. Leaf386]KQT00364.1 sugar ABC transporter [Rhizobium sp. Leaf391]KQT97367.1 sugar ABC transporter [Rhizobium sp. Leaf453]
MTFLTIDAISKSYGATVALDAIRMQIEAGGRTAIVGPSGSGKTTLLRIIAGFETPDSGSLMLDGKMLAADGLLVPAHKRGIGIVSQDGALFPHLTVAENIGFGMDKHATDRAKRIADLMDMVELDGIMAARRPHQLSGGQQQRVALARALALKPRLMLLDEPFSALDTGLRDTMRRTVARVLRASGTTAILVTHDQAEALSFADQVAVLRQGKLIQFGPPRVLYKRPADRETATFLGEAILLDATINAGRADCALGSLEVNGTARTGKATVMLRPEQIRLTTQPKGTKPENPFGRVDDVEFGGGNCMVLVRIDRKDRAMPDFLSIRCVGFELPEPGDFVRISVHGAAHVLAD